MRRQCACLDGIALLKVGCITDLWRVVLSLRYQSMATTRLCITICKSFASNSFAQLMREAAVCFAGSRAQAGGEILVVQGHKNFTTRGCPRVSMMLTGLPHQLHLCVGILDWRKLVHELQNFDRPSKSFYLPDLPLFYLLVLATGAGHASESAGILLCYA